MDLKTIFALCLCFAVPVASAADEFGDAVNGKVYAKKVCTSCHAIEADEAMSPNVNAPSFPAIANTPGMTRTALTVALNTPHATMPNFVLEDQDLDNVIAYILSLKTE